MTERESLLAAVIADPDDDAVRLVYADWLEEYGGEAGAARAEFIRVQIEKESLLKGDPNRAALEAREKELLDHRAEDWLQHLPEWARPREATLIATEDDWFGFRRGFVQGLLVDVNTSPSEAMAVLDSEPITRLYSCDAEILRLLPGRPVSSRLSGLRFGHYVLGDEGTILVSKLPPMPRLRQLWLYENEIGDRGLKALAKWPGLATVEELELGFNHFRAAGIEALIASPYLTSLKRLDLSDSLIATKTKQALRDRFGEIVQV